MKHLILAAIILCSTPLVAQDKTLHIVVDERVELLTTLQLICESSVITLTNADIRYVQEVGDHFGRFKGHPAVATFDSIYFKYFNFEMPFEFILHLALPGLQVIAPLNASEFAAERAYDSHADTLALFARQLQDFYVQTQFHEFFVSHQRLYDSLCADVASTMETMNIVPLLETYYGSSFARYHLVLSPLSLDGGFGITVRNTTGGSVYAIIGPAYTSKGYPQFKKSKTLILHEMSHPFSNPVVDSCWDRLRMDTCLYRPVKKAMQQEGYWSWQAVVYETLDRANEVMLTSHLLGRVEADRLYEDYLGKHYDYLPLCLGVLKRYEADRRAYRTIEDIRPMLLEAFAAKNKELCR
jgi:hypothetical protein